MRGLPGGDDNIGTFYETRPDCGCGDALAEGIARSGEPGSGESGATSWDAATDPSIEPEEECSGIWIRLH